MTVMVWGEQSRAALRAEVAPTQPYGSSDHHLSWVSYWKLLDSDARDGLIPGYAGDFETSIMLALEPQHVEMSAARPSPAAWPSRSQPGVLSSDMRVWESLDGFTGAPTRASAERGEKYPARASERLAEAIQELARADRAGPA